MTTRICTVYAVSALLVLFLGISDAFKSDYVRVPFPLIPLRSRVFNEYRRPMQCQNLSVSAVAMGAGEISGLTKCVSESVFNIEKIKEILPHRFPFLLVDKVLEFEPGVRAVGVKQITANEDHFNGHFPHRGILPGVLQVEALAQLSGIVALQQPISNGKGNFFFAGVDGVKWKKPVVPGDTLVMEVELLTWKERFGIAKFSGRGFVDGNLAIEIKEMTFALVK